MKRVSYVRTCVIFYVDDLMDWLLRSSSPFGLGLLIGLLNCRQDYHDHARWGWVWYRNRVRFLRLRFFSLKNAPPKSST